MEEFSSAVLSSTDISNPENDLYILAQFVLFYPRLKAGGALLPDLIYLYQWIHTELAHLITKDKAESKTAEEVFAKANEKYEGLDLDNLYERVRCECNVNICIPTVS